MVSLIKNKKPRVSIGLPVYNGEKYLDEAIESLLKQTFDDFELIISDNASTDRTKQICEKYARKDHRVSYFRNENNIGAADNFNKIFKLSSGEYFKWAAHDDICDPDLLRKCVKALDENPDIVLCYSKVMVIDENGKFLRKYKYRLNGNNPKPYLRFLSQIRGHQCYEIFGLVRAEALKRSSLIGNYAGGDAVLLLSLCLMGKIYEVNEYLFYSRSHQDQSTKMQKNFRKFSIWFDPKRQYKLVFPYWRILLEYIKAVNRSSLNEFERSLCYIMIFGWSTRRLKRLLNDLIVALGMIFTGMGKGYFKKTIVKLNGKYNC